MKKIILFLLLSMLALAAKDNCFKPLSECKNGYQSEWTLQKCYAQNSSRYGKNYYQTNRTLEPCYIQDRYPHSAGYIQDNFSLDKDTYVKDKTFFGFSND